MREVLRNKTVQDVNAISLYGLSPGSISNFRNLQVCDTLCDLSKLSTMSNLLLEYNSTVNLVNLGGEGILLVSSLAFVSLLSLLQ